MTSADPALQLRPGDGTDPVQGHHDRPHGQDRRQRRRRILAVAGVLAAALIVFVLVYFEPQSALFDDRVNETLPGLDAALTGGSTPASAPTVVSAVATAASAVETSVVEAPTVEPAPVEPAPVEPAAVEPAPVEPSPVETVPVETVPVETAVAPAAPAKSISAALATAASSGAPVVVSSGAFFSGEHTTNGTAHVVALPDGSVVVRFEDLDTSTGPDLRVVLSTDEASESWEYDNRLILEDLKGNLGDQNYTLDPGVDITAYRSVVIWCERFGVAFGAAAISVQL